MEDLDGFYFSILFLTGISISLLVLLYKKRDLLPIGSTFKVLGWNVLLFTTSVLALFLTLETYYRFLVDTTDSFAISKISWRWGERYYQYNNFGARDNVDYLFKKQAQIRRISMFGDSFTVGYGVKNVDKRFANILRKRLYDKEIHVFAGNGHDTDRHFQFLKEFVEKSNYEMDVMVLVYNLNDIAFLVPESKAIFKRIYDYERNLKFPITESYFLDAAFFKWKAMTDPDMKHYFSYIQDSYRNENWVKMQDYLSDLVEYCNGHNIKLATITFPFLHQFDKDYKFDYAHAALADFWKSKGIKHLDLLPAFKKHKDEYLIVNKYDAHPNERAHEIAADAMEPFLATQVE